MSIKPTPADLAAWAPVLAEFPAIAPRKIPGARWVIELADEDEELDEPVKIGTIRHADVNVTNVRSLIAKAVADGVVTEEQLAPETTEPEADTSEAEEDEAPVRVVVAAKYKQEYAAKGNPNNCGDWLASTLDGMFEREQITHRDQGDSLKPDHTEKVEYVFDDVAFAAMLVLNGVDLTGKWAALPFSGQKGWQGRYRMNGRQKLETAILTSGVLKLPNGISLPVDREWAVRMLMKRPKIKAEWLAAQAA